MKKLILCCLVVTTVFAKESTKFADGANDVAEKDVAEKDVADKDVAEKDVAKQKTHRARFEDAVKGYEDAVKEEARLQAEEARAREAKKTSLRNMLQAGGPNLFDEVVKHMEEQDRLLKELTAEMSSVKSTVTSNSAKISKQSYCIVIGPSIWVNQETTRQTFLPAFKTKPAVAVALNGFLKPEAGKGALVFARNVGPTGFDLVRGETWTGQNTLAACVIACGY